MPDSIIYWWPWIWLRFFISRFIASTFVKKHIKKPYQCLYSYRKNNHYHQEKSCPKSCWRSLPKRKEYDCGYYVPKNILKDMHVFYQPPWVKNIWTMSWLWINTLGSPRNIINFAQRVDIQDVEVGWGVEKEGGKSENNLE